MLQHFLLGFCVALLIIFLVSIFFIVHKSKRAKTLDILIETEEKETYEETPHLEEQSLDLLNNTCPIVDEKNLSYSTSKPKEAIANRACQTFTPKEVVITPKHKLLYENTISVNPKGDIVEMNIKVDSVK